MLYGVLDLVSVYFAGGMFSFVLRYVVALAFVATVPVMLRSFFVR